MRHAVFFTCFKKHRTVIGFSCVVSRWQFQHVATNLEVTSWTRSPGKGWARETQLVAKCGWTPFVFFFFAWGRMYVTALEHNCVCNWMQVVFVRFQGMWDLKGDMSCGHQVLNETTRINTGTSGWLKIWRTISCKRMCQKPWLIISRTTLMILRYNSATVLRPWCVGCHNISRHDGKIHGKISLGQLESLWSCHCMWNMMKYMPC